MKAKTFAAVLMTAALALSTPCTFMAEETAEKTTESIETLESEKEELKKQLAELESENAELKAQIEELKNGTEEQISTEIVGTQYSDSATIKIVQKALNDAGYNCGTPDGVAGSKTTEQIKAYEKDKKLNVNGVITDELLESLDVADEIDEAAKQEAAKADYSSDYSYDELARNPDNYDGKKMKFSGEVLQADDSGSTAYARLAINGDYNTVMFITYDPSIIDYRLLEDDQITIYGICLGSYTYETVLGANVTLPWIEADIIEMN